MALTPAAFYVLAALAQGERHGYAIIKEIEGITNGDVVLLPGTLYRLIGQMCVDRWIVEVPGARDDDPRRRYYRMLPAGRKALAGEVARLEAMVRFVRKGRLRASEA
ncbi:MAG TPA: PadR family transcriptional regulator [Candidatus Cybelea sp.]|jgi:DNA-binding PadR family transcriptional regulator|nr:PadR family transcriptional regulator [Candidatus Cybelea sp.]